VLQSILISAMKKNYRSAYCTKIQTSKAK